MIWAHFPTRDFSELAVLNIAHSDQQQASCLSPDMLKKSKKKKTKTSTNIVNKDNCRPGASVKDLISDP